jgi:hypothetical protein
MQPPIPVPPQERNRPHSEGMQQHTHLARLRGGSALPLTLFTQRTGTATTNAGRIDHTQAAISFSALLVNAQGLPGGAAERPIWLGNKVTPREVASFPGQGACSWSLPLCWSEFSGAYRLRMQPMAQFQAQVPYPLADDVPCLLAPGRVTTPAIGVLYSRRLCVYVMLNTHRKLVSLPTTSA